jgi:hypothetical protein
MLSISVYGGRCLVRTSVVPTSEQWPFSLKLRQKKNLVRNKLTKAVLDAGRMKVNPSL